MKKIISDNKKKKLQKIRVKMSTYDYKRILLLYGTYGLKALECIRLKENQIEALKKQLKK